MSGVSNSSAEPRCTCQGLRVTDAMDDLTWIQHWYLAQCDGDWEHGLGVVIDTLDNPGWSLRVDLERTDLEGRWFDGVEVHRSEHDWFVARIEGDHWEAACGPLNLGEVLGLLRAWASGS